MAEVADPVFVQPILDAYFKWKGHYIDHYFPGCLQEIKESSSLEAVKKIFFDHPTKSHEILWVLPAFESFGYFEEDIVKIVEDYYRDRYETVVRASPMAEDSTLEVDWQVGYLYSYLRAAGKLHQIEEVMKAIILDRRFKEDQRQQTLSRLLRIDVASSLAWLGEHLEDISDSEGQILIAKELSTWTGKIIDDLQNRILLSYCGRAKEIIQEKRRKDEAKDATRSQAEEARRGSMYVNAPVVTDIFELREKVNTQSKLNLGQLLFDDDESLVKQFQIAETREEIVDRVGAGLRAIISSISKNIAVDVDVQKALSLLPTGTEVTDVSKPLNRLHVFLSIHDCKIDDGLCGLRLLNRTANLFTHKEAADKLIICLEQLGLKDLYLKEKWPELHAAMLDKLKGCYRDLLDVLVLSAEQMKAQDK